MLAQPPRQLDGDFFGFLLGVWVAENGLEQLRVHHQGVEIVSHGVDVDVLVDQLDRLGAQPVPEQSPGARRRLERLVERAGAAGNRRHGVGHSFQRGGRRNGQLVRQTAPDEPEPRDRIVRPLDLVGILLGDHHTESTHMRDHFPEALVMGHDPLIGALDLPDPDDRHVLAAAIQCGAQHIVTDNLMDFPGDKLEPYDIEAIDAEEFLSRTFDLYPAEALTVLRQLRTHYTNPPYSAPEFVLDLTAKSLPKLAARARQNQAFL